MGVLYDCDMGVLYDCNMCCCAKMMLENAVLAGRGAKRMRPAEEDYDEDDFVVDDEEEPDWRQALKSVTRYDPSKY